MRLLQGIADLSQYVDDAAGRQRAILADQRLQVHAVEKLHHEVERSVFRHTEIVQLDGVL